MKKLIFLLISLTSLLSLAQVTEKNGNSNKTVVTGKVYDNNGVTLTGVNIIVKGTARQTSTNFDGNFSLDVMDGDILKISSIGFNTVEVPVENETIINVTLSEDYRTANTIPENRPLTRSQIRKAKRAKIIKDRKPITGNDVLGVAGKIARDLIKSTN